MKVSIPGFVLLRTGALLDRDDDFIWVGYDLSKGNPDSYAFVCAHALEFETPENFDSRGLKVESLKAERIKLMADFQNRVTEIERKISELTCLEMAA
jgi:hypothetical protein